MPHIERVDNCWRPKKKECLAIIETPKGRRNKLNYNRETELFHLAFILPKGMVFPYDFGFVPSTLAADGDPLDVLVLMDEPADVGCIVQVRLIGVIEAEQREGKKRFVNDRLLAVSIHSSQHDGIRTIDDLHSGMIDQLEAFFVAYNKERGREFQVKDVRGPNRAAEIVDEGIREYLRKGKHAK
jgi:inorganic pyrophosphatase